ncbi:hypothetical protein [Microvirga soli]|uniref:hypothetical protein n=1 Tax=Microvirga soli TaxID=1854496 RepID=UPI00191DEBAD|nr:hypothetical protein [Microvirga soli]
MPDLIFAKAGPWRFFQPSFFGPCILAFNGEDDRDLADFSVDVASPRGTRPARLLIRIRSDGRVRTYPDGAQLYACEIKGPERLAHHAAGRCRRLDDGDFALSLFHHTNAQAYSSIRGSQELWASAWNLRGSRELVNVASVYATSLPRIETPDDLSRIAMASDGKILLQTTSDRPIEEVLELTVYRADTSGRTHTVTVEVPSRCLSPQHLLFHPWVHPEPAYYEVVGPEIYRIGLNPGAKLPIPRGIASPAAGDLKRFDYIVLGDAGTLAGLAAPYDEEETEQVVHHELLDQGLDLFEFWQANANSDQVSGRIIDARGLTPTT